MFVDIEDFVRRLISVPSSIGLVTYEKDKNRDLLLKSIEKLFSGALKKYICFPIDMSDRTTNQFLEKLNEAWTSDARSKSVIVLSGSEPHILNISTILNGFRERLTQFGTFILLIRSDMLSVLFKKAPDLMSLTGEFLIHAGQMTDLVDEDEIR